MFGQTISLLFVSFDFEYVSFRLKVIGTVEYLSLYLDFCHWFYVTLAVYNSKQDLSERLIRTKIDIITSQWQLKRLEARENANDKVAIVLSFASDWFAKRIKIKQNQTRITSTLNSKFLYYSIELLGHSSELRQRTFALNLFLLLSNCCCNWPSLSVSLCRILVF